MKLTRTLLFLSLLLAVPTACSDDGDSNDSDVTDDAGTDDTDDTDDAETDDAETDDADTDDAETDDAETDDAETDDAETDDADTDDADTDDADQPNPNPVLVELCERKCEVSVEVGCPNDLQGEECLDECVTETAVLDVCMTEIKAYFDCVASDTDNLECGDDGTSEPKDGVCGDELSALVVCSAGVGGESSPTCEAACEDDQYLALVECTTGSAELCPLFCSEIEVEFGECAEEGIAATRCAVNNDWECVDNSPDELDFTGCDGELAAVTDCQGE